MKIVNLSQRDDDWLEWRRGGITATDATILLGRSPYKTRWRLWAEKTGYAREVDLSLNPLVRRGVENEDRARQAVEEKHDDLLLPACVQSEQYPLMRASLDGLSSDGKPVELKCPSKSVWDDVCANGTNSKPYQLYYAQVQHQLLVTEAKEGWLVFWYEDDIREFVIPRDEAMIQDLLAEAKEFWDLVQKRKEPEKDPEKDLFIPQGSEAQAWISAAEEYRVYEAEAQELKKRLAELQEKQKPLLDEMKSLMGEYFHADFGGVMVTRYKVAGRVNYKKLLAEQAASVSEDDLEKYRDNASERCRVTVTDSVKPRYIVDEEALAPLENVPEEAETFWF
ncbi:YqaJ viral recombinase family protein [Marinobacter sp. G11]|uniref:YqaJ viral recombinase family nuclease n=1 Tax=Marinobacter sp. G11 TaxID=2903522 RepID=UPI001E299A7C|nr:YqaJ viral recombinase family protein [Marinobacter sp. G11]MCE0759522.1 YqaJ viral recombinase family protein [Marinobacter sp. G11]